MVRGVYFSPTGNTEKIITYLCEGLAHSVKDEANLYSLNLPSDRTNLRSYINDISNRKSESDILIFGAPVYAGRLPNILLNDLTNLSGKGMRAVVLVTFGNRAYDDALRELFKIIKDSGFDIIAAAAFSCEHSFSKILGENRPDKLDFDDIDRFLYYILNGKKDLGLDEILNYVEIQLNPYYKPLDSEGNVIPFKDIKPITLGSCINCGICSLICPMQSIKADDVSVVEGICIKCCACVKSCPLEAKTFVDKGFIMHREDLEKSFSERKKNSIYNL